MLRKLSALLVTASLAFWGLALPASAEVESGEWDPAPAIAAPEVPEPVVSGERADGAGYAEAAADQPTKKQCKKIKNKKKRKKCLKQAQGPQRIEREVEFEYTCPCPGVIQLGSLFGGDPNLGGGPISVTGDDLYLTGVADDLSGTAITVNINQDDGTGANAPTGSFCGETEEPMALELGREIRVFIGRPDVCPGSIAFGGTVTFTLSNMP